MSTLLAWAVREPGDRLLDPSCGDGRFIAGHRNSVGIEEDDRAAATAIARAPWALVHEGDFFTWAAHTNERFECAAGNPPFIRYQRFGGEARERALRFCEGVGVHLSGLASSWAPFLVATASLLRPGGRMAFVVPAEIGHAPYGAPVIDYLVEHFDTVQVVAVREKLFPELSEDCWLLFADGFGGRTGALRFSAVTTFERMARPPRAVERVSVGEWRSVWRSRLRPFIMPRAARELYRQVCDARGSVRFGDVATIGIGYVTGANDFFHLRPSTAAALGIPPRLLLPTVRRGRSLRGPVLSPATVAGWLRADDPVLLLRLPKDAVALAPSVKRYLRSEQGLRARSAYKCRTREPWYSVPDVQVPHFFLTYMSGREPVLVWNAAGCTCTNSLHAVRMRDGAAASRLTGVWDRPLVRLSCEVEGHPLGGGMLKLEPGEAARIVLPAPGARGGETAPEVAEALATLRRWRHCDGGF